MGGNSLGSSSGMTSGNSYNNLRTSGGKSDLDSVESGGVSLATIANLLSPFLLGWFTRGNAMSKIKD